jgi:hypothetical protein
MSLAALIAFLEANPAVTTAVLSILLVISEALGANPRVKSNGFLSFVLLQLNTFLKKKSKTK